MFFYILETKPLEKNQSDDRQFFVLQFVFMYFSGHEKFFEIFLFQEIGFGEKTRGSSENTNNEKK